MICYFQGEKLLGSLGGMFSKTWKPKKTRPIMGPVLARGYILNLLDLSSMSFYAQELAELCFET